VTQLRATTADRFASRKIADRSELPGVELDELTRGFKLRARG
jgi:hypothetical protein